MLTTIEESKLSKKVLVRAGFFSYKFPDLYVIGTYYFPSPYPSSFVTPIDIATISTGIPIDKDTTLRFFFIIYVH